MTRALPTSTRCVIIGAGFAGAGTAWALGRAGLGPGLILEQEPGYGVHASGRNAALLRLAEADPPILTLALRGAEHIRALDCGPSPLVRAIGGLTLVGRDAAAHLEEERRTYEQAGLATALWSPDQTRARFPILNEVEFSLALWCAAEGIVDIHELLTRYLQQARESGFALATGCEALELIVQAGRVVGVRTQAGEVRAEAVIDASGAWAGRLGRTASPLPLRPLRRHLFVSGPPAGPIADLPFTWVEDAGFYFRPEGDGLLFSPCDETPAPPGPAQTDPAAAELLAEKLARHAPGLSDLPIRRSWACLRTFAPDRRPVIGPDPDLPGLFHVSGLGGFGMTTSGAVGELAATLIAGGNPDWIDPAIVAAQRLRT